MTQPLSPFLITSGIFLIIILLIKLFIDSIRYNLKAKHLKIDPKKTTIENINNALYKMQNHSEKITVKELKLAIALLPDNMPVAYFRKGNPDFATCHCIEVKQLTIAPTPAFHDFHGYNHPEKGAESIPVFLIK